MTATSAPPGDQPIAPCVTWFGGSTFPLNATRYQARPTSIQDIATLTLACDLRDLRRAQRSAACSPRLPGVRPSWARAPADCGLASGPQYSEPSLDSARAPRARS
jgi:hypothetical protein